MSSIGESTRNFTVIEVKKTNKNQKRVNYNLCVMSDNSRTARCKKCGKLFKTNSNTTLKSHMKNSCDVVKAAKGSSQTTIGNDGSLWQYEADRVRDRMAKFVIQETLSKRARGNTPSSELGRYGASDFLSQMTIEEFNNLDILIGGKHEKWKGYITSKWEGYITTSVERIQHVSPLEGELEQVEEQIHVEEISLNLADPIDEGE
ncbi:hypothetical protein Tco_1017248 [Tanacetum coccineum]|uniref:BED-type domain-containing protein n=1 Tax=Tanacetum coccineum TaxID=301880 RepID=A0ABQ5FSC3_9ASTR